MELLPTCQVAPTCLPSLQIDQVVDPIGISVISMDLICSKLHKLDSYKSPSSDCWPLWTLNRNTKLDSYVSLCLFFIPGR